MNETLDYKKYAILYVDDEEKSLKSFARAFGEEFRIFTAPSARAGFEVLQAHPDEIGLLMTDQRMPGDQGVWLLEKVRELRPRIVRVLATAYSDLDTVVEAVNTGAIYKYVSKPWDPPQLEMTLKRGLEYFMVKQERDTLFKEKMAVLRNLTVADRVVSLGLLAAGLSHHIRNSLVAVKTFLDLVPLKLAQETGPAGPHDPDFWRDYYGSVQGQVEKINDLLKNLWLASEKPPFQFLDKIALHEMLAGILAAMQPALDAHKITVKNEIPGTLPLLLVDKPKLQRLFELLLKDELISLPAGSQILISARLAPDSTPQRPLVELELQDNGPGLPEEVLRLLFDPFAPRSDSPQEHGISLMACYFIAHHHGGKIEARRAEPHGAIFKLTLPVDPNQSPGHDAGQGALQKLMTDDSVWEKWATGE